MTINIPNDPELNFAAVRKPFLQSSLPAATNLWPEVSETIGDLPPLPSRSMRRIARRSKSSSRGGIVVRLPGWQRSRVVLFESRLELNVLYVLLARGDVIDLWEQPPSVTYYDAKGQRRNHFFDFLIQRASGRREAIAVKPAKLARNNGFADELCFIRQAVNKNFADDVRLITDQCFTRAEAINAERYFDFARHRDSNVARQLQYALETTSFPITIAELSQKLNAGGHGFRTVFLAIYEGQLKADKTSIINLQTTVFGGGDQ